MGLKICAPSFSYTKSKKNTLKHKKKNFLRNLEFYHPWFQEAKLCNFFASGRMPGCPPPLNT